MLNHFELAVAGAVEEDEQGRVRGCAGGDVGDGVVGEGEEPFDKLRMSGPRMRRRGDLR
jgi:hypothetical protein